MVRVDKSPLLIESGLVALQRSPSTPSQSPSALKRSRSALVERQLRESLEAQGSPTKMLRLSPALQAKYAVLNDPRHPRGDLPIPAPLHDQLQVQLRHPHAQLPKRGSAGAAGYDLCSCEDTVILPNARGLVDTGLSIRVPDGTYGRVAPRSGLAVKHFIDTGAGVVDQDYRGIVKVVLFNFGDQPFHIKIGDRVAQLVLERITTPDVVIVKDLDETTRGAGGFGSTGGFTTTAP